MKKLLIMLISVLAIGATLPAIAGGDRQSDQLWNREQARKTKLVEMEKESAPQIQTLKEAASTNSQQADKDAQMNKMMR